jgi:hypothetical protein
VLFRAPTPANYLKSIVSSAITSSSNPVVLRTRDVELAAYDGNGKEIYRAPVVVRRSSDEPDRPNDVGLIQADLPRMPNMKSVGLLLKGQEISRYDSVLGRGMATARTTVVMDLTSLGGASSGRFAIIFSMCLAIQCAAAPLSRSRVSCGRHR